MEQCNACANVGHSVATDANGVTYCSVACVKGISYESVSEGCIPCRNLDGSLNTTPHHIHQESRARQLCEACGLVWFNTYYLTDYCGAVPECADDEFPILNSSPSCVKCNSKGRTLMYSWGSKPSMSGSSSLSGSTFQNLCTRCPERDSDGQWAKRITTGYGTAYCQLVCEHPADANSSIEACDDDDETTICSQFLGSNGNCYACNTKGTVEIGTSEELVKLCQNCGRTASNGYCYIPIDDCGLGKWKGLDGQCYSCTYSDTNFPKTVVSEADSKCVANCKMKDGEYSTDEDAVPTRWLWDDGTSKWCFKECPQTQWQSARGGCYNCSHIQSVNVYFMAYLDKAHCEDRCSSGIYARGYHGFGSQCILKECPPDTDGMTRYQGESGDCMRCDYTGSLGTAENTHVLKNQCERCNNRVYDGTYWHYCILINPGVSGVCNSKNLTLPTNMPDDLEKTVKPWVDGDYDGKMFRGYTGACYECTSPDAVKTTLEQCNMCKGTRIYSGGICSYGGCQSEEFMNQATNCIACSKTATNYINATYQLDDGNEASCIECDEKQVLTIGSTGKKYCVPKTCASSSEWQSGTDGKCTYCNQNNNVREIGTEPIYRELCRACGRVAFSQTVDDVTMWFCSKLPSSGQFVDITGNVINCSSAGDVSIPNTSEAKELCTTGSCDRSVVSATDGTLLCVKN